MDTDDTDTREEDPNEEIIQCTYVNPCCYRIEPAARMALISDMVICIFGIGGCIASAVLQYSPKDSELTRATSAARMDLMWSFCVPIGLLTCCIGASALALCHRTLWACAVWIIAKIILLIVVAVMFSRIHKQTTEYNAAVSRVVGSASETHPGYMFHKRRIRRLLIPCLVTVGAFLFLFGVWFIWVMVAYARHIRAHFLLPVTALNILAAGKERQGEDHALTAWEDEFQTSHHEFVTPGPLVGH